MEIPETWWHWSHTGHLKADPLHAGTILAALHRGKHCMGLDLVKAAPLSVYLNGPYSGAWVPTLYQLRLTRDLWNPGSPTWDRGTWADWVDPEPVLYWNDYEGKVEGAEERQLSVVAPLDCWEVVDAVSRIDRDWEEWSRASVPDLHG